MSGFYRKIFNLRMVAVVSAAAIALSCANKLKNIDPDKITDAPTQVIKNMNASQTDKGVMQMRLEAATMERYEMADDSTEEYFPDSFRVLIYNEDGLLETEIVSDKAIHTKSRHDEKWSAFGNVVIRNYIKGEKIETDTLYWNREEEIIHTDCYVRLSSPQSFMQGYGLKSDQRARNAQLLRPFDSYSIISGDSTGSAYVDTVNFIGPKNKIK